MGCVNKRHKVMYSCNVSGRCLDLLLFSCPVREPRENVFSVEFLKGTDLITVVGVWDDG